MSISLWQVIVLAAIQGLAELRFPCRARRMWWWLRSMGVDLFEALK